MKFLTLFLAPFFWAITVSVKDFKPAFGKWEGTLTYLDYTSGNPYTMPCNISLSPVNSNLQQLVIVYEYPDEPKANGSDTLVISVNGKMIDDEMVLVKEKKRSLLRVITQKTGVDGNENRKAVIRHIYTLGKKSFSIRKEVKFEGGDKWIVRHEYKMAR